MMIARTPPPPPPEFFEAARKLCIEFESGDIDTFGHYLALLFDANTRMNLTRIVEPAEAWMRHVLDSLTLLPYLSVARLKRIIDVGSGGGAPGIPLAIAMPHARFTLLEATGKKARFLEEACRALELRNVKVLSERAEVAAAKGRERRESFDAAIARAVGPLPVLLELTLPFVKVGGLLLAIKGAKADEEVKASARALELLKGNVVGTQPTPTGRLVIVEKYAPSPGRFPRPPGEPKRAPLS